MTEQDNPQGRLHIPQPERLARQVDVLVVGAGPAGLAAAAELARAGAGRVEVLEREDHAGGIPRHSHHTGYGLRDLHRFMSGPAYARHYINAAERNGANLRTSVTATDWHAPTTLDITAPSGLERIAARAVVLATGARERPRSARLIPGARPGGIYTTGQLQQSVYLHHHRIGQRAVIVGAEHVSYSAAVTLLHAGVKVVAMITDLPRQQSYLAFQLGARLRYRFPILTGTAVAEVVGRGRLEAVVVRRRDGSGKVIECDTAVFTGDWIPDHELARRGGLRIAPGTLGPYVDPALRTSVSGVFAAGNLLHPVETADIVAMEGRHVARSVISFLASGSAPIPLADLMAEPPLSWVSPGRVGPGATAPPRGRYTLRTACFLTRPTLVVRQAGKVLHQQACRHELIPNRPVYVRSGWEERVNPTAGPVTIQALL